MAALSRSRSLSLACVHSRDPFSRRRADCGRLWGERTRRRASTRPPATGLTQQLELLATARPDLFDTDDEAEVPPESLYALHRHGGRGDEAYGLERVGRVGAFGLEEGVDRDEGAGDVRVGGYEGDESIEGHWCECVSVCGVCRGVRVCVDSIGWLSTETVDEVALLCFPPCLA